MFNINRLGAIGCAYLADYYGPMDDAYNAGVPTDRVLLRWELDTTGPSLFARGARSSMKTSTVLPVPTPSDMPSLMKDNASAAACRLFASCVIKVPLPKRECPQFCGHYTC